MNTHQETKIAQSAERRAQSAERITAPEYRCSGGKPAVRKLICSRSPASCKPSYSRWFITARVARILSVAPQFSRQVSFPHDRIHLPVPRFPACLPERAISARQPPNASIEKEN